MRMIYVEKVAVREFEMTAVHAGLFRHVEAGRSGCSVGRGQEVPPLAPPGPLGDLHTQRPPAGEGPRVATGRRTLRRALGDPVSVGATSR